MKELAISVRNVSKMYKLYDKPGDRVKDALGLSKKKLYKEHFALSNISFDIMKGECVGIIGSNGAGKSTLLKIITGVLNPSEGSVDVNGRISALLELGAGFNLEYTGIENIYLNGRMTGFSRDEIDQKIDDILAFADIGEFVYQPVKTYSSGMFVRLAFAVAINIEPEILIIDEALSVGDIFFQAKCFRKIEEFKNSGKTILFVSHSLSSIQKYCDRAILLNKGRNIAEGEPKTVIDLYNKVLVQKENKQIIQHEVDAGLPKKTEMPQIAIWKENMTINPNAIEYGNGDAQIIDFCVINENGLISNNINRGELCTIKVRVKFSQTVKDPIIAFTIKDTKGVELAGANTFLSGVDTGEIRAGSEITAVFEQRINLRCNEYLLALGCTGYKGGELTVYHRLYDVCHIMILSDRDQVGLFNLDSKVWLET